MGGYVASEVGSESRGKELVLLNGCDLRRRLTVQTNAGVFSLTDELRDIRTSAEASWTAWEVPGVESVNNDLTIKEEA